MLVQTSQVFAEAVTFLYACAVYIHIHMCVCVYIRTYSMCVIAFYVCLGVANLTNTTYTPNIINVTWDPASSPYCGEVLYYQVVISSDGHCNIVNDTIRAMNLSATFSNLKSNTTYIITVSAVNRATVGLSEMINVATAISSGYLLCVEV